MKKCKNKTKNNLKKLNKKQEKIIQDVYQVKFNNKIKTTGILINVIA